MKCNICNSEMYIDNKCDGCFYWQCLNCNNKLDIPHEDALNKLKEETEQLKNIINHNKSFEHTLDVMKDFGLDMIIYYIGIDQEPKGGVSWIDIEDKNILKDIDYLKEVNISGYTSWCHFYIDYINGEFEIILNELRTD